MRGSTIVGIFGGRFLTISTNAGATFSTYSTAAFNTFEGVQSLVDAGTNFLVAGNNTSGDLVIGRSATGASGSWSFLTAPSTEICMGLSKDADGNVVMVLRDGTTWITADEGDTWDAGPSFSFGSAPSYPTTQRNRLNYIGEHFFFCAEMGGGVTRVYRWKVGDVACVISYTSSGGLGLQSVAGYA